MKETASTEASEGRIGVPADAKKEILALALLGTPIEEITNHASTQN